MLRIYIALVKTHGRGENAWLLFKVKDKFVSKEDITLKDKSVVSKKTLAQLEKTTTKSDGAKRVKESGRAAKFPDKFAAPYSLRPKPGATVSIPLRWDEVKKGLKMSDFTIYNAMERIKSTGDIFKPVLGEGISLEKVIRTFNKE